MSRPRTSVIVLNYNGAHWLDACLSALGAQAGPSEILVVDNASVDDSREIAAQHTGVRVLPLDVNLGFAGGNNAGAAAARATDYLVFLNNDTVVQPGWLETLIRALDERPDIALATSHLVSLHDSEIVDSAGDGYLWAGGAFKRWHGARVRPAEHVEEVFGACGAAFAVKRAVFEALGGFDERFFMVYEDVDLSYRARLLGHRVVYVPSAVVHHAGSATLGRASASAVFHGQRNLEWVWLKNTPGSLLWRTAPAHLLYSVAGCAYWSMRGGAWACLRAKIGAVAGLGSVLAARRSVQRSRRIDARSIEPWLVRGWWRIKQQEKRAR
jgi:GT2 family glycosyltransferase